MDEPTGPTGGSGPVSVELIVSLRLDDFPTDVLLDAIEVAVRGIFAQQIRGFSIDRQSMNVWCGAAGYRLRNGEWVPA